MLAVVSMLVILSLSILVARLAAIALSCTGPSRQAARFQARSAFTGVGFTTQESEKSSGIRSAAAFSSCSCHLETRVS